ncbi:hypothetical protein [Clostridium luticellarii]|jgi:hypothetical protein|uniref:SH3b domain-containing protein n=2 Tax=Clostridium luticellarii TaxID=1691940 RepID=A0A2T0BP58_9CLOT|nr:hypothetical protein [Clostridium luticellarii]MCI1944611.1 hypothetical protein [Clostridium luticellarii]MCI1968110.1 hypothetical protein [Clostridium luticellarii]MCI2039009.1 hypothetical protein [Clostridium luticellarii]PRR85615.1 hypothetical protein CLLU_13700 [Clostridium luticellarii]
MLAFLFIALIICTSVILYNLQNKISSQRRQILSLRYENDKLKSRISKETPRKINVKYITPQYVNAIVLTRSHIYLAPILNSGIVNTLEKNTQIRVHDSIEIMNEFWFEVSMVGVTRINSKGWIKSNYIKANLPNSSSI